MQIIFYSKEFVFLSAVAFEKYFSFVTNTQGVLYLDISL